MKTSLSTHSTPAANASSHSCGFTLTEMLVVMAIFLLLSTALVTTQLLGLKMHRITETKVTATSEGRAALDQVRDEIRMGKMLVVGNGDQSTFTAITNGLPQIGNALQIYPTTNRNQFIRYYLDPTATALMRVEGGEVRVMASFITNQLIFRAEDYAGNVLSNNQNNRVIRMTLEFYQWQFPVATVGPGGMYDYYRLQTRITRRTIE